MKKNPETGHILRTFFTTYAIVLLIVLALSTVLVVNAYKGAKEKQDDMVRDQLRGMASDFDADISFFQYTISNLSNMPAIARIARLGAELSGPDRYEIYMATQTLALLIPNINVMSQGTIQDIYIYCADPKVVLSPTTMYPLDYFVESQYEIGMDPFLSFSDEVLNSERSRFFLTTSQQDSKQYFYFQKLSSWPLDTDLMVIIALMPDKIFPVSEYAGQGESNYMVNFHEEFIINDSVYPTGSILGFADLAGDNGQQKIRIDGKKHVVNWYYSANSGWKHVSIMPSSVYYEDVNIVKDVSFFYLILLCLFGIVTSLVISTRRYHSLAEIITAMSGFLNTPEQEEKSKPPLDAIKAGLDQLISLDRELMQTNREAVVSISRYQQELRNNLATMRQDFVYKVLTGQTDYEIVPELLSMYGIRLPFERFIAMVIHIDDCQSFLAEDTPKEMELARNAITAIVEESIAGDSCSCSIGYDSLGFIVNFEPAADASPPVVQNLHEKMDRIRDLIQGKLGICVSIGIGREHGGFSGCTRSYYEAVQALGYKFYLGLGVVISYSDIQFAPLSYYYSIEEEMRIINALRNGDELGCFAILNEIFNRNLGNRMMNVKTVNLLFLNMMNLVTRVMRDDKRLRYELERGEDAFQGLIQSSTMQEMKEGIYKLYASACRRVIQANQTGKPVIIDQVVKYCNDHYTDTSFSQSEVAEKFAVAPSVLSLQFKKAMELNMTEYISFLRVQKLKEIFNNDDVISTGEASLLAGFNSIKTMIRVFKKFEGITPGNYRKESLEIEKSENVENIGY